MIDYADTKNKTKNLKKIQQHFFRFYDEAQLRANFNFL